MKGNSKFFVAATAIMLALAIMFTLFPLFPDCFGCKISGVLCTQFFAIVYGLRVGKFVKGIHYPLFCGLMIVGLLYFAFVFFSIKENHYTLYSSIGNVYLAILIGLNLYIFSRREKAKNNPSRTRSRKPFPFRIDITTSDDEETENVSQG